MPFRFHPKCLPGKTEVWGLVGPQAVTWVVLGFPVLTVTTYCFFAPQFLDGLAKGKINSTQWDRTASEVPLPEHTRDAIGLLLSLKYLIWILVQIFKLWWNKSFLLDLENKLRISITPPESPSEYLQKNTS